jgi:hypothetical protein
MGEYPVDPTGNYASTIVRMKLLTRMSQPITSRSEMIFLVSSENGNQLASTFEKSWSKSTDPEDFARKLVWTRRDLLELGEAACLHGLSRGS